MVLNPYCHLMLYRPGGRPSNPRKGKWLGRNALVGDAKAIGPVKSSEFARVHPQREEADVAKTLLLLSREHFTIKALH